MRYFQYYSVGIWHNSNTFNIKQTHTLQEFLIKAIYQIKCLLLVEIPQMVYNFKFEDEFFNEKKKKQNCSIGIYMNP